jgi:hypothetical protein
MIGQMTGIAQSETAAWQSPIRCLALTGTDAAIAGRRGNGAPARNL